MNQQFGNQIGQRAFFGGAGNMNQGATRMMGGAGSMGMMGGNMANQGNFGAGMSANFGNQGGFGQMGMSQGVPQQQLNQIHQNSIFNGASQPDNMQVQRIHQATISGEEANPMRGAAFGGTSMGMMGGAGSAGMMSNMGGAGSMGMMSGMGGNMANQGNFGAGMSANFGNQNQGGFGQMGMSQGVSQQQLNQIHQNSIFNGASQPDNMQVQRIHQATISGEEANPMRGAAFGGTSMGMMSGAGAAGMMSNMGGAGAAGMMSNMGGAGSMGMMGGMGGAGSMGMMGGMGGYMANQGNFGTGMSANFGNQGGFGQMGMSQGVSQQQLNQIHQNSIFNGTSQPDNIQVQRIHQATISGEEMNPLSSAFGGGFGGSSMGMGMMSSGLANQGNASRQGMMSMMGGQGQSQGFVNPSALNAVLNADAGIRDQQGPNRYPAAMYTGSNQFDNVNQSVLNQLTRSF